jgi:hypothetical protein
MPKRRGENMNARSRASECRRDGLTRILLLALVLAATAGVTSGSLHAQVADLEPGDALWEIRLADGTTVVGRVVATTTERVTLETGAGTRVEVARDQIRSARPAGGQMVDGAYWFEDPNHTRLFLISPTGRSLERGEGYVSAFWVVLPFVAYGVTDHFTIAGGTPVLPGAIGRIIYLAPKLRVFDGDLLDVAVGALSFFSTDRSEAGSIGIGYGVATLGTTDRAATVGAGWGYFAGDGEFETSSRPMVMLGGDMRVGRTAKLVTENFFVPGERGSLLSGGIRLFGERIAVDFGIAGIMDSGDFFWFPAGNFVYNFGRR